MQLMNRLSFLLLLAAAMPVEAHSLKYVEDQLRQDERYTQLTNQRAPNFALEDAYGNRVSLADFKHKVVVLNFIYARCKEECPLQSRFIASLQEQLNQAPMREQVQFVSIATDTEDAQATATAMRNYAGQHGLDTANWAFLYRGSAARDATITLAKQYGLEFVPTAEGEQMHGVVTFLIDQGGLLRARYHGLKFKPANLIIHVAALLHAQEHDIDTASTSTVQGAAFGWRHIASGALGIALIIGAIVWLHRSRSGKQS
jgi:protein SCO1